MPTAIKLAAAISRDSAVLQAAVAADTAATAVAVTREAAVGTAAAAALAAALPTKQPVDTLLDTAPVNPVASQVWKQASTAIEWTWLGAWVELGLSFSLPSAGGTGIANNDAATTTRVGNFAKTETLTAATGVTYPVTGTLATLAGAESFSNKTLAGVIALAANGSIGLGGPLADLQSRGETEPGTAGAVLGFGALIYLSDVDGRWELVNATGEATSGPVKLGICVQAAADGNATVVLRKGKVRSDAAFPALSIGKRVYASTSAGLLQVAKPTADGAVVRVVGYANTANELDFDPSTDYVTSGLDTTKPLPVSASVDITGNFLTAVFNEAVNGPLGDNGLSIVTDGAAVTLDYFGGDGTSSRTFQISRTLSPTEALSNLTYAVPVGGVIEDLAGNDLDPFSGMAITNGSGGTAPTPTILWWKLNDGSGIAINADVGSDGTTSGTWTTDTQSTTGAAQVFDGLGSGSAKYALSIDPIAYGSPAAITLSFWTRRNDNAGTQIIFECGPLWTGNPPAFVVYMSAGRLNAAMVDPNGGIRSESVVIDFGTWKHVAIVFDQAANSGAGEIKIYFDGISQTTTLDTNTKTLASTFIDLILFMAARSGGQFGYDGDIDDVQIHTGEISAGQVATITAADAA
jgi:concanavalin A-like lectin/glucanase superfamily protein